MGTAANHRASVHLMGVCANNGCTPMTLSRIHAFRSSRFLRVMSKGAAVSEITASASRSGHRMAMPVLQSGADSLALETGTYTLGGRGPNALLLASLDGSPEVATIVVPPSGAATIQRLTASIVVRLDQTPIGIAPKELPDGVEIEFNGCRLTFRTDDAGDTGEATLTSTSPDEAGRLIGFVPNHRPDSPALPQEPTTPLGKGADRQRANWERFRSRRGASRGRPGRCV